LLSCCEGGTKGDSLAQADRSIPTEGSSYIQRDTNVVTEGQTSTTGDRSVYDRANSAFKVVQKSIRGDSTGMRVNDLTRDTLQAAC
jgi:hypothetical protein